MVLFVPWLYNLWLTELLIIIGIIILDRNAILYNLKIIM